MTLPGELGFGVLDCDQDVAVAAGTRKLVSVDSLHGLQVCSVQVVVDPAAGKRLMLPNAIPMKSRNSFAAKPKLRHEIQASLPEMGMVVVPIFLAVGRAST